MTKHDVLVTTRDQIPVGEGRTFIVGGQPIAIFQTHDGGIYATQPQCPHKHGPLADGLLGGTTLMCPLHDRTFDLKTGCGPEPRTPGPRDLRHASRCQRRHLDFDRGGPRRRWRWKPERVPQILGPARPTIRRHSGQSEAAIRNL